MVDAAALPNGFNLSKYSAAVLAELHPMYAVFLSVSLAERTVEDPASSPEKRAEAEAEVKQTIDRFLAETSWHLSRIAAAGALPYIKNDFVIRFIVKRISRHEGGPVDTSRACAFTDRSKLGLLAEKCA